LEGRLVRRRAASATYGGVSRVPAKKKKATKKRKAAKKKTAKKTATKRRR
jgi:hypothetical protein